ncbi:MAG: glycine cleavage system aminomethyltransferase GcvT [Saccharofermentanales bacterium]
MDTTLTEKKTPLYDIHVKSGGKVVPFAGFLLPVQYGTGIIAEHLAVRTHAGLFDVSHMGEVLIEGPGAFDTIQQLFTNDFSDLADGRMRYSPMCSSTGGVIDDIIVYRFSQDKYLVVVNASNIAKDYAHIAANLVPDTQARDQSDLFAQVALQGPESRSILEALAADGSLLPARNYSFADHIMVAGLDCLVSFSGYTGEAGYEIYTDPANAAALWESLLDAGRAHGLIPCGLGARDTLRLEASMPLYGHELSDDITPFEAGLGRYVHLEKTHFIGRQALAERGAPDRIRVGLELTDRGIAREHADVFIGDARIGVTTSGTFCPFLNKAVAMALVGSAQAGQPGTDVEIDVRGRRLKATTVALPFYKRKN